MLSLTTFVFTTSALIQLASATINPNSPIQLRITTSDGFKACLAASNPTNGSPVTVTTCADSNTQYWKFPSGAPDSGSSSTQPIRIFDNYCLDVTAGRDASGTKLQIWSCGNGNGNQEWIVKPVGSGDVVELQWAGHSRCVDNTGGMRNGTQAQIWTCGSTNKNQQFNPVDSSTTFPPGTPTVFAHDKSRKTCFGVDAKYNGSPIINVPCEPQNEFNTWIQSSVNGPITMGDFCLDATDGKDVNGNPLQLWTCYPNSGNQRWTLEQNGNIRWFGKGKCVDETNGNVTFGNRLQLWSCINGNTNQVWYELPPL